MHSSPVFLLFFPPLHHLLLLLLLLLLLFGSSLTDASARSDLSANVGEEHRSGNRASPIVGDRDGIGDDERNPDIVTIGKCCDRDEILVDDYCTPIEEATRDDNNATVTGGAWRPEFLDDEFGGPTIREGTVNYELRFGRPICRGDEHESHVYYYPNGGDRLAILGSGKLRHFVAENGRKNGKTHDDYWGNDENDGELGTIETLHYDYPFGHYCIDEAMLRGEGDSRLVATYAMVCVPILTTTWTDATYFMGRLVDPTFRALAMLAYLHVAVIYFVLPQLRDLIGNMITSMCLCLLTSQCATTVRIFTEYGNHVSFLVADTVAYVSLLAAFFWLNAIGYYVWITFRSRNVFLRTTDGRKYCYYSSYVWGSTIAVSVTAIFAHFALETSKTMVVTGIAYPRQETVGWLGLSVLFSTIAFTIIVDLCFLLTTSNTIKRMSTYGRIHHKMKYSFRMFAILFCAMSLGWLSLLLAQLKYEILVYSHITINLSQAILIFYVCVFGQKRVMFLLGKTCNCCSQTDSPEGLDWGEEMTAMNAGY